MSPNYCITCGTHFNSSLMTHRCATGWQPMPDLQSRLTEAEAKLAIALEALEFYGAEKSWDVVNGACEDMQPRGLERKLWKVLDMGDQARTALSRIKEKKEGER